ncbi:hypothetical protein OIU85_022264 [Salix viminalis]|uniref:Uncharacterized protein n=1 Tax=Salix viminalis TaxID=40686 RepID=A0A9Q0Z7G7_SALVM|nr:hypothetical protein OIU85_022264 [Salix viminalis]
METFGDDDDDDDDDFVGCIRRVGFEMGVPWKEEEVSKGESFWDFVEREVRVVAMVAMMNDSAFGSVLRFRAMEYRGVKKMTRIYGDGEARQSSDVEMNISRWIHLISFNSRR